MSANLVVYCLLLYRATVPEYWNCVFISFFIDTDGNAKSYGHMSVSSCSSKDELPNGLVTIESGLTYYVCLNGFNWGTAAAVCRQLGYLDADPVPSQWWTNIFWTTWRVWVRSSFHFSLFLFSQLAQSQLVNFLVNQREVLNVFIECHAQYVSIVLHSVRPIISWVNDIWEYLCVFIARYYVLWWSLIIYSAFCCLKNAA